MTKCCFTLVANIISQPSVIFIGWFSVSWFIHLTYRNRLYDQRLRAHRLCRTDDNVPQQARGHWLNWDSTGFRGSRGSIRGDNCAINCFWFIFHFVPPSLPPLPSCFISSEGLDFHSCHQFKGFLISHSLLPDDFRRAFLLCLCVSVKSLL